VHVDLRQVVKYIKFVKYIKHVKLAG